MEISTTVVFSIDRIVYLSCSDLKPVLDTLGLYFQIRDDYANLYSEEVSNSYYITVTIYELYELN